MLFKEVKGQPDRIARKTADCAPYRSISKQIKQSKVTRTNQWPIANKHQTAIQPTDIALATATHLSVAQYYSRNSTGAYVPIFSTFIIRLNITQN